MRRAAAFAAAILALASGAAWAQEDGVLAGRRAARPDKPDWDVAASAYWNAPKGGDAYGSAIFAASRGRLHLEARVNYEAVHAQSAFVGWTFSGGEAVKWEFTPILGGVAGDAKGPIAGVEASLASGRFDFYVEAEAVRDRTEGAGTYTYAWSELGYRPAVWLRAGLVAQRTRVHGGEREFQRGPFVQLTRGAWTLGAYWFNPGSSEQVRIVSLGVAF